MANAPANPSSEAPTARGFEAPRNTQFSVFLDNRVGRLRDLLECFDRQAVALAGLSVVESADHAVVRLLTSRAELTRRILNRCGHASSEVEVTAVELKDDHSLVTVCQCLMGAELNIHYAYPLLVRPRGRPVVAIHTDDYVLAGQLLMRRRFGVLAENDLGDNAPGTHPGGD